MNTLDGIRGVTLALSLVVGLAACEGSGRLGDPDPADPGMDAPDATDFAADLPGETPADLPGDSAVDLPSDGTDADTPIPDVPPPDVPADVAPPDVPTDAPADADVPPDGACAPGPALEPFSLTPYGPVFGSEIDSVLDEDAVVTFKGPEQDWFCGAPYCDGLQDKQVTLNLPASGKDVSLIYSLPLGQEIPVRVGQWVHVYLREVWPWWKDTVLVLWDAGGAPVFLFHDAAQAGKTPWWDCGGKSPCPSLSTLPETCLPVPSTCGMAVYPPVEMALGGGLSSSEVPVTLAEGETAVAPVPALRTRYLVARSRHNVTMECVDYPDRWLSAAIMNNRHASQCLCRDDADCALHSVCEPRAGRCVPDLCDRDIDPSAVDRCGDGQACDSFTGTCVTLAGACTTDADCSGTPNPVCTPRVRPCTPSAGCTHAWTGTCIPDYCADVDCANSCSPLLQRCYGCIADCECPGYGTGGWCDGWDCRACDVARIGFTQDEPYDFWVICATKDGLDEAALKALDPEADCGVGTALGKCDATTEIACMGGNLKDNRGRLADSAWERVCDLATIPWITRISGGFYEK